MKQKKLLAVAALLSMSAFGFSDGYSATGTADAYATISNDISISTVDTPLNFGSIIPSTDTAGTVEIAANSLKGDSPSVSVVTMASIANCSPGHFKVYGDAGRAYAVTLPTDDVTLTRSGGSETMTVGTFTANPSTGYALTGGEQALAVGATLNVGANQYSGEYRGQYTVTVAYTAG